MELEHMRRVLAEKCMEWALTPGKALSWYDDKDGNDTGYIVIHNDYIVSKSGPGDREWQPDINPKQMMDVVNMMRKKGWRGSVNDAFYPVIKATCYRVGDPFRHYDGEGTECEARMIAAYRALQSEAADD